MSNPDDYPVLTWDTERPRAVPATYRNQNGEVDLQGLQRAIRDFTNDWIDLATLQSVIDEFVS